MVKSDITRLYYHVIDHRSQYAMLGRHTINDHEYIAKNRGDGRLYVESVEDPSVSATLYVDNMTTERLESEIILLFKQLE